MTHSYERRPIIIEGTVKKGNIIGNPTTPRPKGMFKPFSPQSKQPSNGEGNNQSTQNSGDAQQEKK